MMTEVVGLWWPVAGERYTRTGHLLENVTHVPLQLSKRRNENYYKHASLLGEMASMLRTNKAPTVSVVCRQRWRSALPVSFVILANWHL